MLLYIFLCVLKTLSTGWQIQSKSTRLILVYSPSYLVMYVMLELFDYEKTASIMFNIVTHLITPPVSKQSPFTIKVNGSLYGYIILIACALTSWTMHLTLDYCLRSSLSTWTSSPVLGSDTPHQDPQVFLSLHSTRLWPQPDKCCHGPICLDPYPAPSSVLLNLF